ncbi:uncharacterized protein [Diabrotica undecimpunctata]|uniref:uncharacterized protein n=1 Tax=Diabrotica undecimpunctata TaxID=50387 RepID=UPI003B63C146
MVFDAMSFIERVPETVEELEGREEKNLWIRAMERKIESINKNNTWTEVEKIPEKIEILNTKWVFASKPLEAKEEDRYMAKLVVRGFAQRGSFDYEDLYSPVAKIISIKTLLTVGNQCKCYLKS